MTKQADPGELLPLSPPVYHVLLALGDDTLHGYGIMQALEDKTDGQDSLLPGTLYATLSRMVEAGLVQEPDEPPDSSDARRRYYRLTPFGRAVARAESERLRRLLSVARQEALTAESGGNP